MFFTLWGKNCIQRVSLPSILCHYADMSEEMIEDLENVIDSPSNGILMAVEMHTRFDQFAWYFEPTVCSLFSM
jgi:hypothetical protein